MKAKRSKVEPRGFCGHGIDVDSACAHCMKAGHKRYEVEIRRVYTVRQPSEDDAVLKALELEETEAHEWPNTIDVRDAIQPGEKL